MEPRVWSGHGLTVSVTVHALQTHAQVAGELNLASAPVLAACLENQLDTGRSYARLDLGGVDVIDAAGIAALVEAHHAYLDRYGLLAITAVSRPVANLVRLLDLDDDLLIAGGPPGNGCRAPGHRRGRGSHLPVVT